MITKLIYQFNSQSIYNLSYNLCGIAQAKFPDVCEDKYNYSYIKIFNRMQLVFVFFFLFVLLFQ